MNFKNCLYKVVFVMILLFILLGFKNVFASDVSQEYNTFICNDLTYYFTFPKDYTNGSDYSIVRNDDEIVFMWYPENSFLAATYGAMMRPYTDLTFESVINYSVAIIDYDDTNPNTTFDFYNTSNVNLNNSWGQDISEILFSTLDVYNKYGQEGEVFFQQTPLIIQTRLAPIVEKKQGAMEMALKEIIAILPMILVVVVSFLGLRKALRMLSMLLHRS